MHRLFFRLLLIFLPTQLGLHLWPAWALVLGRRVDYLSPTLFFTDILLVLTVASWLVEKFSRFRFQFSLKRKKNTIFKILGILIFVGSNILVSSNWQVSIYKWLKIVEFSLLGLYILQTKPAFSFAIGHVVFGLLFSSVLTIAQFVLQRSIGGPLWWLGERTFVADTPGIARIVLPFSFGLNMRPYATFPHPNVLGGYLAAVIPLLIFNKIKNAPMIQIFSIIFGSIALVLTFSRSAIIVAVGVILLIFYTFVSDKNRKHGWLVVPLLWLSVAAVLFLFPVSTADESVVVRQQLNEVAVRQWAGSPIVGVGLGNFLVDLPDTLPSREIYFLQPVHNIYLFLLSETGIVGLGIFLWIVWRAAKPAWQKKNLPSPILFSLIAVLLLGLVDHYPLTIQQGQLLLTFLLGLSAASAKS